MERRREFAYRLYDPHVEYTDDLAVEAGVSAEALLERDISAWALVSNYLALDQALR